MGFFSYLKDVTSGKIKNQNELIHGNIAKLIQKVSPLEDSDLIKDWITTFSLIAGVVIEQLLFKETEAVQFNKHVKEVDEEKAYQIFKLIGGYYLHAFLINKDIDVVLKHANIDKEEFEKKITAYMDYDNDDKEEYRSLIKLSESDRLRYFTKLNQRIWQKGFGINVEGKQNIHEINYFGQFLGRSFLDTFIPEIAKRL